MLPELNPVLICAEMLVWKQLSNCCSKISFHPGYALMLSTSKLPVIPYAGRENLRQLQRFSQDFSEVKGNGIQKEDTIFKESFLET